MDLPVGVVQPYGAKKASVKAYFYLRSVKDKGGIGIVSLHKQAKKDTLDFRHFHFDSHMSPLIGEGMCGAKPVALPLMSFPTRLIDFSVI